jgi:hypothetical protein
MLERLWKLALPKASREGCNSGHVFGRRMFSKKFFCKRSDTRCGSAFTDVA